MSQNAAFVQTVESEATYLWLVDSYGIRYEVRAGVRTVMRWRARYPRYKFWLVAG